MRNRVGFLFVPLFLLATSSASGAVIDLYDWAFYVDGTTYEAGLGDAMPTTGTLDPDGLGQLTYQVTDTGFHQFVAYFDFEIDQATNTFYNEYGGTGGTLATGQSWEIDEPGWAFGNLHDNALAGTLDNQNGVPEGANDDVAFALGWDFTLNAGETATITLNLSDILAADDFYLYHADAQAGPGFDELANIYFWSSLSIQSTSVPEPSSLLLTALGLGGIAVFGRRRRLRRVAEHDDAEPFGGTTVL